MSDTDTRPRDYDDMAAEIESTIAWIDDKIENGRIRDPERARARAGYLRVKITAISEWRKLREASDLEELSDRVEELEQRRQKVTV